MDQLRPLCDTVEEEQLTAAFAKKRKKKKKKERNNNFFPGFFFFGISCEDAYRTARPPVNQELVYRVVPFVVNIGYTVCVCSNNVMQKLS